MSSPPTSIAAATRSGAGSTATATATNPYPDGTPEAEAWQVARDASEAARAAARAGMLQMYRFHVRRFDEVLERAKRTIELATAERAEALAEIERLTRRTTSAT